MSIYDLLRITYTYESRALEKGRSQSPSHPQQSLMRPRADSTMSVCEEPEACHQLLSSNSAANTDSSFAARETDFTALYKGRCARSVV